MKFGIDTLCCDHGKSGVGSYLTSLVKNIPDMADVKFELFGTEVDRFQYNSSLKHITYQSVKSGEKFFFQKFFHKFRLKKFAIKNNYDAILYPSFLRTSGINADVPGVAVIHASISELFPDKKTRIKQRNFLKSLASMKKIIAPSQYVRNSLISNGIDAEKIIVIHNGIDHSLFYPRDPILQNETVVINPFSIKRPYLIYASSINGDSKKHCELIKAFALFKKNTGLPHRLVLAGNIEDSKKQVQEAAALSGYVSDIVFTGFFPHENLNELYSASDACIFPSVSEGVGLPVLEAMACHVPVACARSGALPEIGAENAVYFDPDDTENFALCIEKIITDQKLRERLTENVDKWTKRFSWDKTAEQTINVLISAAKE